MDEYCSCSCRRICCRKNKHETRRHSICFRSLLPAFFLGRMTKTKRQCMRQFLVSRIYRISSVDLILFAQIVLIPFCSLLYAFRCKWEWVRRSWFISRQIFIQMEWKCRFGLFSSLFLFTNTHTSTDRRFAFVVACAQLLVGRLFKYSTDFDKKKNSRTDSIRAFIDAQTKSKIPFFNWVFIRTEWSI